MVADEMPAFPSGPDDDGGLTIRDWFAGQALAGMLASPRCWDWDIDDVEDRGVDNIVRDCFHFADAMVAAGHPPYYQIVLERQRKAKLNQDPKP